MESLLKTLFLLLSAHVLAISAVESNPDTQPPNVVIFFADDLGYGDLDCFGHPTSSSPNINDLAAKSKVLKSFYVASAVCSPSRASLMTGLYPVSTGMYPGVLWPDSSGGLSSKHKTLASHLKGHGYKTQMVGKWHLGVGREGKFLPTNHGFDGYYGVPYSHDMCPCVTCFPNSTSSGDNAGGTCKIPCNEHYVACPTFKNDKIIAQPTDLLKLTKKYTDTAVHFIRENSKAPFFLYMAFAQTHHPQFASRKFHLKSDRGPFGDSLAEMDHSIGEVMRMLEDRDLLENTLVIFTSDNGPSMKRHEFGGSAGLLKCGKGTTYEGGQRVPAIFSWPGKIPAGTSHEIASTLDILPTVLAMVAPDSKPPKSHGVNIAPHLLNPSVASERKSFAFYSSEHDLESLGPYAIRYKQFKAHFYTQGNKLSDENNYDPDCRNTTRSQHWPPLMFDLNIDPGERYPLAVNSSEYERVLEAVLATRDKLKKDVTWADSETLKPKSRDNSPCCNPKGSSCEPFPSCCNCNNDQDDTFYYSPHINKSSNDIVSL